MLTQSLVSPILRLLLESKEMFIYSKIYETCYDEMWNILNLFLFGSSEVSQIILLQYEGRSPVR